ncbi:class I SAM-dependent methyltransferase [Desulfonatronovibrio hydrogenovorans]|uniref:class I SAM-dependent methyltransferase n=1 Tax=Desulfonatronovibrio hydrogenovorans TaxID=53245 RepID=UPI00048F856A|nr:class I SAM-dependent methyltransferase [Desulfonatronovibrio hydrogenovorans]
MNPADDYQTISRVYDLVLNPLLDSVRRDICRLLFSSGIRNVVDLGCGTGRQCAFLHKYGIKAHGVDRSPSMLQIAGKQTPEDIEYHLKDITNTGFADHVFDCALISLALHEHQTALQEKILDEALRIIKPAGVIALLDHGRIEGLSTRIAHYLSCIPERLAGRRHFRNYLSFMNNGGLQGLVSSRMELDMIREQKYFFGGLWLCLARIKTTPSPKGY